MEGLHCRVAWLGSNVLYVYLLCSIQLYGTSFLSCIEHLLCEWASSGFVQAGHDVVWVYNLVVAPSAWFVDAFMLKDMTVMSGWLCWFKMEQECWHVSMTLAMQCSGLSNTGLSCHFSMREAVAVREQ